nr:fibrinopeptide A [Nycticebus coucang]
TDTDTDEDGFLAKGADVR